MKLEDQYVSLDLAKKMKEAGCNLTAEFCWYPDVDSPNGFSLNRCFGKLPGPDCYFACSVSELGEALPWDIINCVGRMADSRWFLTTNQSCIVEKTEADARALIWLYLKEKGLI
ncbi:MAG: hypothetical protein PHY29_02970 [Syntrophales bacterium]|nr:hypothetical protein [Syntrophales bacterium]